MATNTGRLRFLIRAFTDFIGIAAPFKTYDIPTNRQGKRILIFNWRDQRHTHAGGAEVYVQELAKRWVEEGSHVTLFCGSDGGEAPRHEQVDGINVIRRGGHYFVYLWAFMYYSVRFRGKFDLIVDCHNGIPFFTPLFTRLPVICVVHHIHQEVFKRHLPQPFAAFACFLEAKVMPRAYKYSQYVTVSESTKHEMEDMGMTSPKGIDIVYNGVDLDNLRPAKKAEKPLIVFLGRLQAYKSIDVLIHAFSDVIKQQPDAKLVIAGGGEAEHSLKDLVHELHLDNSISFAGKVSEQEKRNLFQKAWLMVNPSMKEGWGITTIEANACATPVIGSDVPGLRDSIVNGKTGELVPYGNIGSLATHIKDYLGDEPRRIETESSAYTWSQKFKWENSAHKLYDLISKESIPVKPTNKSQGEPA